MQKQYIKELSKITATILEEPVDYANLVPAIKNLKALFLKVSEVDTSSNAYRKHIHNDTGKAIGPEWAAMCIDDFLRTKRFMGGTHDAIAAALKNKKNQPVTLLYVGTGPFATLVLPLTTIFSPEELQLVLVEINPISLESLKNCIKNLGLEAYVKNFYDTDAARLQVEEAADIDILLLECMQLALIKEQQVPITYNLVPQLREDVILVPEEIKLSMCLVNGKKKMEYMMSLDTQARKPYYKKMEPVFVLNKENVTAEKKEALVFSKTTTPLSEQDKSDFDSVNIATEICVFGNQKLEVGDCGLTLIHTLDPMEKAMPYKAITSQYFVNESPGWEITYH